MTENDEENTSTTGIYSKFWRITLVFIAMLLIFIGPTYIPYLLVHHFKLNYYVGSIGVGGVLFVIGMAMMLFLIRKKLITV